MLRRFLFLCVLFSLSFMGISCGNPNAIKTRKVLDNWQYSIDDGISYHVLPKDKISSLQDLIPGKEGYIRLRTDFIIPAALRGRTLSLCMERIMIACDVRVNNVFLGRSGLFPPRAFSAGTAGSYFKMPIQMLLLENPNTVELRFYVNGSGGISDFPVIADSDYGFYINRMYTTVYSTLNLMFASFLMFAAFGFFLLYSRHKADVEHLYFAFLNISTVIYIFPYFMGEFPWLTGFMDYLWLAKISFGCFGFTCNYLAGSFAYKLTKVQETTKVFIFRLVSYLLCIAACFSVPSLVFFYDTIVYHVFLMIFLVMIPFVDIIVKNKANKKSFLVLLNGFMPVFLGVLADMVTKGFFKKTLMPYYSIYGWQLTIIGFIVILSKRYADVRRRTEYLNLKLDTEVRMRTEELTKANMILEQKNKQAQRDLILAEQVQKAFYPHKPEYDGWDIAVAFMPLSGVSGDLYDFYADGRTLKGFGLYDVSGHGISSGLVTMLAKSAIDTGFKKTASLDLSDAMQFINDKFIRVKGNIENYLTGTLFRIDEHNPDVIELVNAGNPYPVYRKAGREKAVPLKPETEGQRGMLGVSGLDVAFKKIKINVSDGDIFVLYTDGLSESENNKGEQFGHERIYKNITLAGGSAASTLNELLEEFRMFTGNRPLNDDITVMVIKRDVNYHSDGSSQGNDFYGELEQV